MEGARKTVIEEKIIVAHVAGGMTTGGVEQVVYDHAAHQREGRYRWIYISYNEPDSQVREKFESLGFQVYQVPRKKEHFLKSCLEVYRIFKEQKVRIVHSHMTVMCFITNILAWAAGIKMRISHSHLVLYPSGIKRPLYGIFKWLDRVTATHWVACSQAAGEYLFGKNAVKNHRVWVMGNGLDYSRWKYSPVLRKQMRTAYGLEDMTVLGHVGRFTEQKNHAFLLEVFRKYNDRIPRSRLVMAGDGPLMDQIKEKALSMGILDAVLFVGSVPDPSPWYMAMDLFVFPSVYEGLGIVALEAQATGLPVLASEEVPKEAALTEEMRFLALEEGAQRWADMLMKMKAGHRETDLGKILKERNLDIGTLAEKLDRFYQNGLESADI